MHARRLLFVRPRIKGHLAAIYGALMSLVSLSLAGFLVAFWPEDPAPAARLPSHGEAAYTTPSAQGGIRVPPDAPAPRNRGTWM
jgi:hypothetical protein